MARGLSIAAAVLGVLVVAGASAHAQQGTGELRGRILDAQSAVLPGVTVVAKNEASGQFREIVSGADGSFFMSALTPGSVRGDGAALGLQEVPARRRARRGRQDAVDRRAAAGRRHRAGGHRHRRIAAGRHDDQAARRQRADAGAAGRAVGQPELHVVSEPAARRDRHDFHRLVRRRLGPRQRAGDAERELHAGRRRQQRQLQQRQRRRAGAGAGRSGAGIPAPDQPVRRRVRPELRRRRQRRVEAGDQQAARHGVLLRSEPDDDVARLLCREAPRTWRETGKRSRSSGAATWAARSSRTSSTSS